MNIYIYKHRNDTSRSRALGCVYDICIPLYNKRCVKVTHLKVIESVNSQISDELMERKCKRCYLSALKCFLAERRNGKNVFSASSYGYDNV